MLKGYIVPFNTLSNMPIQNQNQNLRTPAEEVWLLVQQWYFSRGKRVPAEDEKVCKEEIAKEAIKIAYYSALISKNILKDQLSITTDHGKMVEILAEIARCEIILAANPELKPVETKAAYGTDSFWKDYWAKKKANGWVSKKEASASTSSSASSTATGTAKGTKSKQK